MMHDIHFHQGYTQYPLDFSAEQLSGIDFSAGKNPAQPSFIALILTWIRWRILSLIAQTMAKVSSL